jgi:excisionase family DNA binding protein
MDKYEERAALAHRFDSDALLTPGEVAFLFRVDPKTVTRWARAGKLHSVQTIGGHRRYRESDIRLLLKHRGLDPNSVYERHDRYAPDVAG